MHYTHASVALTLSLTAGLPALAGTYQSVFTLTTPYTASSPHVTHVVLTWTSVADDGVIGLADITDWSVELLAGGTTVFADHAIIGGVVQDLGGVSRAASDLRFQFDFSSQGYRVFDTMYFGSLLSGATGTTFNTYLYEGFAGEPDAPLGIWSNGDEGTRQQPGYSSHVFSAVPAPGALVLLAICVPMRKRSRSR
jgi:hypothetical protein